MLIIELKLRHKKRKHYVSFKVSRTFVIAMALVISGLDLSIAGLASLSPRDLQEAAKARSNEVLPSDNQREVESDSHRLSQDHHLENRSCISNNSNQESL